MKKFDFGIFLLIFVFCIFYSNLKVEAEPIYIGDEYGVKIYLLNDTIRTDDWITYRCEAVGVKNNEVIEEIYYDFDCEKDPEYPNIIASGSALYKHYQSQSGRIKGSLFTIYNDSDSIEKKILEYILSHKSKVKYENDEE